MNINEKIKYCVDNLREVPDVYKKVTKLMNKLMTTPDREGYMPEIFLTMSNRTGGKTYYIAYLLLSLYKEFGTNIMLLTRSGTSLGKVATGIFGPILEEFQGWSIEEKIAVPNVYSEIYITFLVKDGEDEVIKKELFGYVGVLNASKKIKNYSGEFYNVELMFMDEFLTKERDYIADEVNSWIDVHMTVARGGGYSSRYVPVIMAANSVSSVNPYFTEFGLNGKIQNNTKFYRGVGLSLLRFINDEVAKAQKESRFNKACTRSDIFASNVDNQWLEDNMSCVTKPQPEWGRGKYIATFKTNKQDFGLYMYPNGIYYISRNVDKTCKEVYALTVDGMENVETAKRSIPLSVFCRQFLRGYGRFSDLALKYEILKWI